MVSNDAWLSSASQAAKQAGQAASQAARDSRRSLESGLESASQAASRLGTWLPGSKPKPEAPKGRLEWAQGVLSAALLTGGDKADKADKFAPDPRGAGWSVKRHSEPARGVVRGEAPGPFDETPPVRTTAPTARPPPDLPADCGPPEIRVAQRVLSGSSVASMAASPDGSEFSDIELVVEVDVPHRPKRHLTPPGSTKGGVGRSQTMPPADAASVRSYASSSPSRTPMTPLEEMHLAVERGDLERLDTLLVQQKEQASAGKDGDDEKEQAPEVEAVIVERDRLHRRLKRAATEQLAAASGHCKRSEAREQLAPEDIDKLQKALETAKRRTVDADDVEEAELLLERVASKAAGGIWASSDGAAAFQAIKKDDVPKLQECLLQAAWAKWKDEAGRGLREAATEHGAAQVLAFLDRGSLSDPEWKEAFRLVCRDDAPGLAMLLHDVSPLVWAEKHNQGGKTLLELAEERSKHHVYAWLAMSRGLVKDLPPESVSVDDAVWVFEPQNLQPRPARVAKVEDGKVHVLFWDEGNEQPSREVNPLHLRKMQ